MSVGTLPKFENDCEKLWRDSEEKGKRNEKHEMDMVGSSNVGAGYAGVRWR